MVVHNERPSSRRTVLLALLLLAASVLSVAALMFPILERFLSPSLQVGQVAPEDILAPQAFSYTSEVLTQQRREEARNAVLAIYTPPDTSVARQQLEHLRTALAYVSNVRMDAYAAAEQKASDLMQMEDIHLDQALAVSILTLSESRWQAVQQESIVVLEQVMRGAIREDQLDDFRHSVPNLVSLSMPEGQAAIVADLVSAFVVPNSHYSDSLTEAARKKAYETVNPIERSFIAGETIIQRGRVLAPADVEALQKAGLSQISQKWQDPVSAAALVLLMATFMVFYLRKVPQLTRELRDLVLISGLFLASLLGARLIVAGHTVIPYAYPLAAYGLLVCALFGPELALVSSLALGILAAYGLSNALDLSFYYILGSLFGILALGQARRMVSFLWAGIVIAVAGATATLAYRLPIAATDWQGISTLVGAALFNGLAASSLAILFQFFLAYFLGMVTPMQLMELTRPDHPLLRLLLRDSPGTYQHSLQVANLAEQAAERIGADTLLVRVGALYHDCGKALNPVFFVENQMPGYINPHHDLDPVTSAATIIRHVTDGVELAHKHRLPRRIQDFIREHHGTLLTRYQYIQAVTAAGGDESSVDAEPFRYPGPPPQSRETAILMLADGCEARVRGERPKDDEELRAIVKNLIDNRLSSGQLDETNLTMRDINLILESFLTTLRNVYHPRIQYPKLEIFPSSEEPIQIVFPPKGSADVPTAPVDRPASTH